MPIYYVIAIFYVVDFSSRGPSLIGDPKPDLMSIGAHGFVPSNIR